MRLIVFMMVVMAAFANKEREEEEKAERKNGEAEERDTWEYRTTYPPTVGPGGDGEGDNNSTYLPPTYPPPAFDSFTRPADCADYLMQGYTQSGVYIIYPFTCSCSSGVRVWCDMETDGGGWTVFLNRQKQNSQLDFDRTWDEYKTGFGNPNSEYYMGNELLHKMTYSRDYAIRLDFEMENGNSAFVSYASGKVNNEENRYQMTITGTRKGVANAKFCLNYMSGRFFTTKDRDSDNYNSGNCAVNQGGGWWYMNCLYFNPTSTYNQTLNINCHGYFDMKITKLQMKLRPNICDDTVKNIQLNHYGYGCYDMANA